jgi:hypothetical protein
MASDAAVVASIAIQYGAPLDVIRKSLNAGSTGSPLVWLRDPSSWDTEKFGPRPYQPDRKVPLVVEERFIDRVRKRKEWQREREALNARAPLAV